MITTFMPMMIADMAADAAREKHTRTDVLVWGSVLIVAIVIGGAVVATIRKWLNAPPETSEAGGGFSLADLRELRDRGELTPAEYEAARAKIIAKVKGAASGKPGPEAGKAEEG